MKTSTLLDINCCSSTAGVFCSGGSSRHLQVKSLMKTSGKQFQGNGHLQNVSIGVHLMQSLKHQLLFPDHFVETCTCEVTLTRNGVRPTSQHSDLLPLTSSSWSSSGFASRMCCSSTSVCSGFASFDGCGLTPALGEAGNKNSSFNSAFSNAVLFRLFACLLFHLLCLAHPQLPEAFPNFSN